MAQISEFFKNLFSTADWPARWHCGKWSDFHGWLYIISDIMIWVAYFLIPIIILDYLSKKKTAIRFKAAYLYFALFILLCGMTHFIDAVMFWIPVYRVSALVRFLTAIVSLITVYLLIKMLPELSKLKTNVELEKEIAHRKRVELKLAEANAGLSSFAAIASHDLQEPLRKIKSYTGLLNDRIVGEKDPEIDNYSVKIVQSATRMQALIENILMLSTLRKIELHPVDLNVPLKQALENLELRIVDTSAQIKYDDLPVVFGNEEYLAVLFNNLISNAIKFSVGRPTITIRCTNSDLYTQIRISDNGIGIHKLHYDKIFEPFERLNTKQDYPGTGLGLAICKKIVEINNGSIAVEENDTGGTTFVVKLILHSEHASS